MEHQIQFRHQIPDIVYISGGGIQLVAFSTRDWQNSSPTIHHTQGILAMETSDAETQGVLPQLQLNTAEPRICNVTQTWLVVN